MTRISPALAVLVMLAFPVGCGGDEDSGSGNGTGAAVTIELLEDGGRGPFTATGDAVDDGLICSAGEMVIVGAVDEATGQEPTASSAVLLVDQDFTCDDGSGVFTTQATQTGTEEEIVAAFESGDALPTEDWEVISGTGQFEGLQGSGTISAQPTEPGSFTVRVTFAGILNSE